MNFEETQQDGQRSRALLGIALVVVLLVAAGALFFVWRPEAYQGAVAALTSSPKDTSEPLVSAGATPVATGQALAGTPGATASPRAPAPRPSASDNASVEQVVEQQGGIEQRLHCRLIVTVTAVAELTVDGDLAALLLQQLQHILAPQADQRIARSFGRTTAFKAGRARVKQSHLFLVVQPMQQRLVVQADQLFGSQRVGQDIQPLPGFLTILDIALAVRRQRLQQEAPGHATIGP